MIHRGLIVFCIYKKLERLSNSLLFSLLEIRGKYRTVKVRRLFESLLIINYENLKFKFFATKFVQQNEICWSVTWQLEILSKKGSRSLICRLLHCIYCCKLLLNWLLISLLNLDNRAVSLYSRVILLPFRCFQTNFNLQLANLK